MNYQSQHVKLSLFEPTFTPAFIFSVLYYIRCVISAFKYIHSLGVAYRDLKPENLLMDSEGYLKVKD